MYIIGYIDDDPNEIDHFKIRIKRFNKTSPKKIQLKVIELNKEIKENILKIIKDNEIQGIIIDHLLNEKGIVSFQGSHIMNQILSEINDFPTIILTNDIRDAENHSHYVHNVYAKKNEKNIDHTYDGIDDEIEIKLRKEFPIIIRLLKDIENFKEKILNYENRILELIEITYKRKLNSYEEEELLEKDTFMEKLYSNYHIPKQLKKSEYEDKLITLIDETKKLIGKIEENEKN